MIAGCIDRMSRGGCAGCERQSACEQIFPALASMLGGVFGGRRQAPLSSGQSPLRAFFSEVAKAAQAATAPRETPMTDAVEQAVEPLLASGSVRIEAVARSLGLGRQTLYRRLKAEEVTFEEVLDRLRRRLALRLIREEGMSVKEAAWRLGFSDPAAFSRAYKRWTGRSPTASRG